MPTELEQYLHIHIPLSKSMQVSVIEATVDAVVLSAPLAPNINHQETVFGGSSSALAILASWSLVHFRMRSAGISSRLVIQRNWMTYERPILGTFTARAFLSPLASWEAFNRMLSRKGRARISVSCDLDYSGQTAGHFEGEFVAIRPDISPIICTPEEMVDDDSEDS